MPAEPGALAQPDVEVPAPAARCGLRLPWFPLAVIGLFVLAAVAAPLLGLPDPHAQSLRDRFKPPAWEEAGSWKHPLGTDRLGRDLLSRIVWGSRVSLAAGGLPGLGASAFGAPVGLTAGYHCGPPHPAPMPATHAPPSLPLHPLPPLPRGPRGPP